MTKPQFDEARQRPHAWPTLFVEALSENDPKQLEKKVAEAEAAIFLRLQTLLRDSGGDGEVASLREASKKLLGLKTNVLKFPDWRS